MAEKSHLEPVTNTFHAQVPDFLKWGWTLFHGATVKWVLTTLGNSLTCFSNANYLCSICWSFRKSWFGYSLLKVWLLKCLWGGIKPCWEWSLDWLYNHGCLWGVLQSKWLFRAIGACVMVHWKAGDLFTFVSEHLLLLSNFTYVVMYIIFKSGRDTLYKVPIY